MTVTRSSLSPEARRREILRQASVALQGRSVTLWEVSQSGAVAPLATSRTAPPYDVTALDVDATLGRWGVPIRAGSRWVGGRVDERGRWCLAPVRTTLPAPPPAGVERRSPERMTLELAGLCLGLAEGTPDGGPQAELALLQEFAERPSVLAHEVNNQLVAARSSLSLCIDTVRKLSALAPSHRSELLADLANVALGLEHATAFLQAVVDRARGAQARIERFDAVKVVSSCVTLLKPLVREKRLEIELVISADSVYLRGDPNGLYQIVANLIHNAADASVGRRGPIIVTVAQAGNDLRIGVQDHGRGIAPEFLGRIFEGGFTTKDFGAGSGHGLLVVQEVAQKMFGGRVAVESAVDEGALFTVTLPLPPQRRSDLDNSR